MFLCREKIVVIGLASILNVLIASPAFAEKIKIGVVGAANPLLTATDENNVTRPLKIGEPIYFNEKITTNGDGNAQLLFLDRSALTVGSNASIVIDKFVYDPSSKEGEISMDGAKGAFRFIGGVLSKKNTAKFKTPVGTIGIRGGIALVNINPTNGLTNATFVYGDIMTFANQAGDVQSTTDMGFAISLESPTALPTKPVQVDIQDIAASTQTLAAPEGSTGGVEVVPTQNDVDKKMELNSDKEFGNSNGENSQDNRGKTDGERGEGSMEHNGDGTDQSGDQAEDGDQGLNNSTDKTNNRKTVRRRGPNGEIEQHDDSDNEGDNNQNGNQNSAKKGPDGKGNNNQAGNKQGSNNQQGNNNQTNNNRQGNNNQAGNDNNNQSNNNQSGSNQANNQQGNNNDQGYVRRGAGAAGGYPPAGGPNNGTNTNGGYYAGGHGDDPDGNGGGGGYYGTAPNGAGYPPAGRSNNGTNMNGGYYAGGHGDDPDGTGGGGGYYGTAPNGAGYPPAGGSYAGGSNGGSNGTNGYYGAAPNSGGYGTAVPMSGRSGDSAGGYYSGGGGYGTAVPMSGRSGDSAGGYYGAAPASGYAGSTAGGYYDGGHYGGDMASGYYGAAPASGYAVSTTGGYYNGGGYAGDMASGYYGAAPAGGYAGSTAGGYYDGGHYGGGGYGDAYAAGTSGYFGFDGPAPIGAGGVTGTGTAYNPYGDYYNPSVGMYDTYTGYDAYNMAGYYNNTYNTGGYYYYDPAYNMAGGIPVTPYDPYYNNTTANVCYTCDSSFTSPLTITHRGRIVNKSGGGFINEWGIISAEDKGLTFRADFFMNSNGQNVVVRAETTKGSTVGYSEILSAGTLGGTGHTYISSNSLLQYFMMEDGKVAGSNFGITQPKTQRAMVIGKTAAPADMSVQTSKSYYKFLPDLHTYHSSGTDNFGMFSYGLADLRLVSSLSSNVTSNPYLTSKKGMTVDWDAKRFITGHLDWGYAGGTEHSLVLAFGDVNPTYALVFDGYVYKISGHNNVSVVPFITKGSTYVASNSVYGNASSIDGFILDGSTTGSDAKTILQPLVITSIPANELAALNVQSTRTVHGFMGGVMVEDYNGVKTARRYWNTDSSNFYISTDANTDRMGAQTNVTSIDSGGNNITAKFGNIGTGPVSNPKNAFISDTTYAVQQVSHFSGAEATDINGVLVSSKQITDASMQCSSCSYTHWGIWASEAKKTATTTDIANMIPYVTGEITAGANVQAKTGTGTYSGNIFATSIANNFVKNHTGTFTAGIDFDAGGGTKTSITSYTANISGFNSMSSSGTQDLSSGAFSNYALSGTNMTGVVNGALFGPSAQEMGGNIKFTDTSTSTNGAGVFIGAGTFSP